MTQAVTDLPLVSAAEALSPALPGTAPWLAELRGRGLAAFRDQGLPGRRTEAWKYSYGSLKVLKGTPYHPSITDDMPALGTIPGGKALNLPDAHTVVFVNGRYDASLSDSAAPPAGLTVTSLAKVLETEPQAVEPRLGRLLPLDGQPFAALATGMLADGLVVRVARGAAVEKPLHVVSIAAPDAEPISFAPRLLVLAEEGSIATIVESHIGTGGDEALANLVTEIEVAEDAVLSHYLLQNQDRATVHLAATQAIVRAKGRYERFALSMGASAARDEVRVELAGEHAEARVNGAYAAGTDQHMDTTCFIDHAVPCTQSQQTYKGVLDGNGRGVFQGRIHIRRDAQKCEGNQLHKALLLSRQAEVDTKPELTIFADDVKCSHGAASGEIDEDALFYLRARGISEEAARALLIEGFLDDVIDGIGSEAVKNAMITHVHAWLEGLGNTAITEVK